MKKMLAFLLVDSRLNPRRKRIDPTFVLIWAGIAVALWILLAAR